MTEVQIINRLKLAAVIWSIGCVITYGHAVKQFTSENEAECAAERQIKKDFLCDDEGVRFDAFMASIFWPQHWSEALWK